MTSNLGSDIILKTKEITPKIKNEVESILHRTFRPEFLNRIDAICFFQKLSQKDVIVIAKIQIAALKARLKEQQITLSVTADVIKKLAELGYSSEFGARPLKRVIQQKLTVPFSQYLLKNPSERDLNAIIAKGEIVITE